MSSLKLRFERHGSGPAVVLLHGLLGSRINWRPFSLRLAEHYQVFVVDQRNHGESPHAPGMTYRELARDVSSFLEAEVGRAAHLLGHSMGGKTAMRLALDRPAATIPRIQSCNFSMGGIQCN